MNRENEIRWSEVWQAGKEARAAAYAYVFHSSVTRLVEGKIVGLADEVVEFKWWGILERKKADDYECGYAFFFMKCACALLHSA